MILSTTRDEFWISWHGISGREGLVFHRHRCSPPTSSSAAPWNDIELIYWHPNLHMTLVFYYFLTLFIPIIWFFTLLQLHIISFSITTHTAHGNSDAQAAVPSSSRTCAWTFRVYSHSRADSIRSWIQEYIESASDVFASGPASHPFLLTHTQTILDNWSNFNIHFNYWYTHLIYISFSYLFP